MYHALHTLGQYMETIHLSWETDGEATLQLSARHASRQLAPKFSAGQRLVVGVALSLMLGVSGYACIMSFYEGRYETSFITFLGVYFVLWLSRRIFVSRKGFERRFLENYRAGIERGDFESTAGQWECEIDDNSLTYKDIDRKRLMQYPLSDFSCIEQVGEYILLFKGRIFIGHLPNQLYHGMELVEAIQQRIALHNPDILVIR